MARLRFSRSCEPPSAGLPGTAALCGGLRRVGPLAGAADAVLRGEAEPVHLDGGAEWQGDFVDSRSIGGGGWRSLRLGPLACAGAVLGLALRRVDLLAVAADVVLGGGGVGERHRDCRWSEEEEECGCRCEEVCKRTVGKQR